MNINKIRAEIIGDSGASVAFTTVIAILAFVQWPPDAFAVGLDEGNKLRALDWLQGDAVGHLTVTGDNDDPAIAGDLRSIADIDGVSLGGKVVDSQTGPEEVRRNVTIRFRTGDDIQINLLDLKFKHLRDKADEFINLILSSVAGVESD